MKNSLLVKKTKTVYGEEKDDGLAGCHIFANFLIFELFGNTWNLFCGDSFLLETVSSKS